MILRTFFCSTLIAGSLLAAPYDIETIQPPEGVSLEVGGMRMSDAGTLYMSIRRGDVWTLKDGKWKLFAIGLQEPLGVVMGDKPGEIYVLHRPELTRLVDEDGDGVADLYDSFGKGWGFSANYHEYAMGLVRDDEGNFYGGLGLPFSHKKNNKFQGQWLGTMDVHDRGWVFKITKDGKYEKVAPGVREPVGWIFNDEGQLFTTDTQGSYIPSNYLIPVYKNEFLGHPDGLLWDNGRVEKVNTMLGLALPKMLQELDKMRVPPAVYIPYREYGSSVGGMIYDKTGGKFGPFEGQLFIADVMAAMINRVTLEKVQGVYQGAIFPLIHQKELEGGSHKMDFDKDGDLWVGQTARGWGRGSGLKKVHWNGQVPTEIKSIKLAKYGFDLEFTKAMDPKIAGDPKHYALHIFHYQYTNGYGAQRENRKALPVRAVKLSPDGLKASLLIDGLEEDRCIQFDYKKLQSKDGEKVQYGTAWYTLNRLVKS